MNLWKLIKRSLYYYKRTHLSILAGAALSTAILTGALIVGDSVRYSLKQIASARLGQIRFAMDWGERFFRTKLAEDLSAALNANVAPVFQINGIVIGEKNQKRANRVQVFGVDERFWELGNTENQFNGLSKDEAVINRQLARQLGLDLEDEFLIRIQKIQWIPGDVPFSAKDNQTVSLRLKVKTIIDGDRFGRFNLETSQIPPLSVFLPIELLSRRMELKDRANVLLVGVENSEFLSVDTLNTILEQTWNLADAGIRFKKLDPGNVTELSSERIFIDSPITQAIESAFPQAHPILTYFVNQISFQDRYSPYAFVSAPGSPLVPESMEDDAIILNDWLATDLGVSKGQQITLSYYIPGEGNRLVEDSASFRIRDIVQIQGPAADRNLMPHIPGLSDSENCRDWDPGIPVDINRIRDKDERYWDTYGGTPKAFITLNAARNCWASRFGSLTSVRFQGEDTTRISARIKQHLSPSSLGMIFQPVREASLKASSEAVDFGQLFLGLSFFLVISALLLTALLFVLHIEQRSEETGLLLALGFPKVKVKKILFAEGGMIAVLGGFFGMGLGILYNQVVLLALGSLWIGATGTSDLILFLKPSSLIIGTFSGILMAVFAMRIALARQTRKTIRELQRTPKLNTRPRRKFPVVWIIIGICLIGLFFILLTVNPGKNRQAAGAFWAAGFLILTATLSFFYWFIKYRLLSIHEKGMRLVQLGRRNVTRRLGRSITCITLLALGIFIVIAVGANRIDPARDADLKTSGTGGFTYFGETTHPVREDLNTEKGLHRIGLNEMDDPQLNIIPFRMREGDDASCLNLNRIQKPRILGVNPEQLKGRFSFEEMVPEKELDNPWLSLNDSLGTDIIPAIADQTVIIWSLGKEVGDTLTYTNEQGQELKLKLIGGLANSIFQGNVLISEKHFTEQFPSNSGVRIFLIDTAPENKKPVGDILDRTFQDYGLDLMPAAQRLAAFNTVQNTYLTIFSALGGLGLIIGTIGLGIIVFRNVMERRGELALLRAVGYNLQSIRKMLLAENRLLLLAGTVCGTLSAVIAVLPAILSPGSKIPYLSLSITLIAIFLSGLLWTHLATHRATRGNLLPALRKE